MPEIWGAYFREGLYLGWEESVACKGKVSDTVNSLVNGHPRELKKVSVSRAVRLRELFL